MLRQASERLGKLEGENERFPAASRRIGRGTKEKLKELVSTAIERWIRGQGQQEQGREQEAEEAIEVNPP